MAVRVNYEVRIRNYEKNIVNDKSENKYPKVGVGVIVAKDGKILIGKRKNAHGEGSWAFPGGHLKFGETWEECARREVMEETGIRIKNVSFARATNDFFPKEAKHYITIYMYSEYASGKVILCEPEKCEEWIWTPWDNLPKPHFIPLQNLLKTGYDPLKK
ncbi:MAG: NUDIX hydrolase [Parcubacteria group bacterium Gr01-1014_33]|nr:MAG: NUDIX hydrolase [Parcubacteria group bacterium Gr01-1014_33]